MSGCCSGTRFIIGFAGFGFLGRRFPCWFPFWIALGPWACRFRRFISRRRLSCCSISSSSLTSSSASSNSRPRLQIRFPKLWRSIGAPGGAILFYACPFWPRPRPLPIKPLFGSSGGPLTEPCPLPIPDEPEVPARTDGPEISEIAINRFSSGFHLKESMLQIWCQGFLIWWLLRFSILFIIRIYTAGLMSWISISNLM